ncbi:MAG: DNA mismatch repair endonuclease MutL [Chitinophagaceae bacterium]
MENHIYLLPDNIANQIAAGEVIQRPANAVKELLENAIDAQATQIQLIIAEGGKNLIQVIDNGKGMNDIDARMCFERHATSKIKKIDDLFQIHTMGFRGEALASIAAVAHVELKTRTYNNNTGTYIEVESSEIKKQEPCATSLGTNIAMKNIFFNIPARRHFLKSNTTETKHILEEFTRIALSFPEVQFSFTRNQQLEYHLPKGNLKQRIIQLFGNNYENNLLEVNQKSDFLAIYGFIGKPKIARKTRGEQYFIVNHRFIKNPYLHHAINTAFNNIIEKEEYPFYVLMIEINPLEIDVNIHPTKQEIKFSDDRLIYTFLQSSIKQTLAQFSITPSIDFELDKEIQNLPSLSKTFTEEDKKEITTSSLYQQLTYPNQAYKINSEWQSFFESSKPSLIQQNVASTPFFEKSLLEYPIQQLFATYILVFTTQELLIFQQSLLHQTILYHQFIESPSKEHISQVLLSPEKIQFSPSDTEILKEITALLQLMGYHITAMGENCFKVHAIPTFAKNDSIQESLEILVEYYKHASDIVDNQHYRVATSLAKSLSIHAGMPLNHEKIKHLLELWLQIGQPEYHFSRKKLFLKIKKLEVQQWFS